MRKPNTKGENGSLDLQFFVSSLKTISSDLRTTADRLGGLSKQLSRVSGSNTGPSTLLIPYGTFQPVGGVTIRYGCRIQQQSACKVLHKSLYRAQLCQQKYCSNQEQIKKAAKLVKTSIKNKIKSTNNGKNEDFEKKLIRITEESVLKSDFVSKKLPQIVKQGDVVLKVHHLPGTKSVKQLNSMLSTRLIHSSQVVAAFYQFRSSTSMNIRIVTRSDSEDTQRILNKDGSELLPKYNLVATKTDFKDLETFMSKNCNLIVPLEDD